MSRCTKSVKFHFRWGTKPRDQKQETENDCDVISELQALQISTTFSYFLINNALLYHFLANRLAHDKKMTKKSVFCEAWSPELTSQSFSVSCFLVSRFCTPPEVKFDAFDTSKHREGKSLSTKFFCYTCQQIGEIYVLDI